MANLFRNPNTKLKIPWGFVLLCALVFSGYQYGTTGQVTWLTSGFQYGERVSYRIAAKSRTKLVESGVTLPQWFTFGASAPPSSLAEITKGRSSNASFSAPAWDLSGITTRVIDGDTIEILDATDKQHRIRLHGIDAPERGQPFGRVSERALVSLIAGKGVGVDVVDTDRYGRTVGVVYLGNKDINLTMVETGYAWWYKRYAVLRDDLREAQEQAQAEGLGLWSDENPIAPWDWRRRGAN